MPWINQLYHLAPMQPHHSGSAPPANGWVKYRLVATDQNKLSSTAKRTLEQGALFDLLRSFMIGLPTLHFVGAIMLRFVTPLLAILFLSQNALAASIARVELNALEPTADKCRAVFLTENKSGSQIAALKLDFVFFNTKGVVFERFIGDLAPILAAKTVVKNFDVNAPCDQIGSVLVNAVTACAPASAVDCLQGLELSSRVDNVRFYQ